jgi:hypothetical protein
MKTIDIWFDSTFLERQDVPRLGLPDWAGQWIEQLFVGMFGPPIFHFWILQELVDSCQRKLNDYRGRKIIVVDVSINKKLVEILLEKIVNSDGKKYANQDELFVGLEMWLTEQLAAWLSMERAHNSWPTVVIRCVDTEWKKRDRKVYEPEKKFRGLVKLIFPQKEILGIDTPLFGICFPDPEYETRTMISLISPYFPSKCSLTSYAGLLGSDFFLTEYSEIENFCPLLSQYHAWIAVAYCPLDEKIKKIYIRHEEFHETWIVENNIWSQVPREAWVPVSEYARVILGRVIDVGFLGHKKKKILSGSLILRIE